MPHASHALAEASLSSHTERRTDATGTGDCAAATAHGAPHRRFDASIKYSFSSGLEPSADDATILLNYFRTFFTPRFPFVTIPVDTSSEKLRQEKPYLSRTIRMVAAHNRPVQQLEMGKSILKDFSTTVLFKAEKSLDLLQAMLVYNAWLVYQISMLSLVLSMQKVSSEKIVLMTWKHARQYYHFTISSRTTTILQLTLGLMFELGINAPRSHEKEEPFSHEMKNADDKITEPGTNTADEQRAFLGCFFFASV